MPAADTPTGTLLGGRYLLTRQLGSGSSATVYLAEDQSLKREVAVKVLRAGLTADGAFLKRFRAEAVAVAGLNHPHVLRVFDWGEAAGTAWLVTEYLSGGSLRDLLDRTGTLPAQQVASIGAQAADGLAYAHARGFVHRDVKPTNLLFDDAGRVRITDFGVARALAEAQWTEPSEGLIGTVRYSSPEQALGRPVDPKSDVYSLALVLYECVTGVVPFAADTQVATLNARVGATLPAHPALGPLASVLARAAAPEPHDRLSAEELWSELTDVSRVPASAGAHRIGFNPPSAEELTGQHPAVGAPHRRHASAPVPPRSPDETLVTALVDATVVGSATTAAAAGPTTAAAAAPTTAADADAPAPPAEGTAPGVAAAAGRRHRRRWPVLVVLVAAGLIAYGAVLGTTPPHRAPSFRMPREVGQSINAVESALGRYHLHLSTSLRLSKTVPPGIVMAQSVKPGTLVHEGAHLVFAESGGPPPVTVPTVVGDASCAAAAAALSGVGFKASCPASLAVYSETAPAGTVLAVYAGNAPVTGSAAYGSALQVQLSKGRPPVPVPSVVGLPGLEAVARLDQAGFAVTVHRAFSTTVHAGNVISTTPSPRQPLQPGKDVVIVVSEGAPITVPSLGHVSLAQAEKELVDAGLTVVQVIGPANSTTWTSVPAAGTQVSKGTGISLSGSR